MKLELCAGYAIGNFQVEKFLKVSADRQVESYLVRDSNGNKRLLKIYETGKNYGILECTATGSKEDCYPLLSILTVGRVCIDGLEYDYIVREYVDGERLSDIISKGKTYAWEDALPIIYQVLVALKHLHSQIPALIHNNINPRNILIKEINRRSRVYVIGMGHLSHNTDDGKVPFDTKDLNDLYRAPETFKGIYNVQTDLFATGALLYTMIMGEELWRISPTNDIVSFMPLTEKQVKILNKLLEMDSSNRYESVDAVFKSLRTEKYDNLDTNKCKGFKDVAGMKELKQMLFRDVLFVMQNKLKAEKYRLKLPNGMLLYGPPGCGKTFLAEKFAEESNFNFVMVKASDLGSIYIHGTQGKIAELFRDATDKAPTILCFDELDGMVPDRSLVQNEGAYGEVNEFLSQLNNCAERGIFVIGTSNRPDKIDPAVLRTGRLDKLVYVPIPDKDARGELFKIQLNGRYCDETINLDDLAEKSEGYVASDIGFIVNQSALKAAISNVPISQQLIIEEIENTRCSVTPDALKKYEGMRQVLEIQMTERHRCRVGFKTNL